MTPQVKLRLLASVNPALRARLGTNPFRWFDIQLDQRAIRVGTCIRVQAISSVQTYQQAGRNSLTQPRIQFDVLDQDPEVARAAAAELIAFLGTVDLSTSAQFGSPTTTPQHCPSFVLNQRSGMEPIPDPPVYVETIDVRFFNQE